MVESTTADSDERLRARALAYEGLALDIRDHVRRSPRDLPGLEDTLGRLWSRVDTDHDDILRRTANREQRPFASFIGTEPQPWNPNAPIGDRVIWFATEILRLAVNIKRLTDERSQAEKQTGEQRAVLRKAARHGDGLPPGAVLDEVRRVLKDEPVLQNLYLTGQLRNTDARLVANLDREDRRARDEARPDTGQRDREPVTSGPNISVKNAAELHLMPQNSGRGRAEGQPAEVTTASARAQIFEAAFLELPRTASFEAILYDRSDMTAADNFPKSPVTDRSVLHRPSFASEGRGRQATQEPVVRARSASSPPAPSRRR
ncbi:MAG TPA: hypothetical protein VN408_07305 [Actinoplanes sp.]|nr:hypothetical protein [Actinoplanes sp.]